MEIYTFKVVNYNYNYDLSARIHLVVIFGRVSPPLSSEFIEAPLK